jgi:pyruvate dehydrogenase E2 component (dihydrolipoamide acetyltransferase)
MRKIIADRMVQSHLQAPPVTLNVKADVTELVALRKQINERLDIRISFNDFILKATAIALAETPGINASLEGDEIVYKTGIHLGMAVAVDDGILVPVIKDADTLSLKQIAQKAKELSAKAREEKLTPDECSGGTFTVSNLGMYDIVSFTPLLNPPESTILGVCTIENELKMIGEKIENTRIMGLSLTIDHRIIDGAQGAVFLQHIKSLLENPLEIVVS